MLLVLKSDEYDDRDPDVERQSVLLTPMTAISILAMTPRDETSPTTSGAGGTEVRSSGSRHQLAAGGGGGNISIIDEDAAGECRASIGNAAIDPGLVAELRAAAALTAQDSASLGRSLKQ